MNGWEKALQLIIQLVREAVIDSGISPLKVHPRAGKKRPKTHKKKVKILPFIHTCILCYIIPSHFKALFLQEPSISCNLDPLCLLNLNSCVFFKSVLKYILSPSVHFSY